MTETRGGPPVDYADDSVFPAGDSVSPGVKEGTFAAFKAWLLAGFIAFPSFVGNAGKVLAVNALEDDVEWVTGGGGGGGGGSNAIGAHRYWRISDIGTSSAGQAVACSEIRLRSTVGGADLAVSAGRCIEQNGSFPIANTYDGNVNTLWGVGAAANTPLCVIVYDMGADVAVGEVAVTARNDGFYGQAPRSFTLAWSDDDEFYTEVGQLEFGTFTAAAQVRTATVPANYPYGGVGGGLELIATITLGSAAANIDFTGIPADYKDLEISFQARGTTAATNVDMRVNFNNDTSAIYGHEVIHAFGNGTTFAQGVGQTAATVASIAAGTATAKHASTGRFIINNYSATAFFKQIFSDFFSTLGTGGFTQGRGIYGGHWGDDDAIDRVTFTCAAGNFDVGTTFSLYGRR